MAYCSNCGVEVVGRHCSNCGHPAGTKALVIEGSAKEIERVPETRPKIVDPSGNPVGYVRPAASAPAPSMGSTNNNAFTHDAEFLLRNTGERIAWQGKPSPAILVPRIVGWVLVLAISIDWAAQSHTGWGWVELWAALAVFSIAKAWLNWYHTLYRITSQRLEYSSGFLSRTTAAANLCDIHGMTIRRPFPWSLSGLGNLELDIADRTKAMKNGQHQPVVLRAIRNLESVRDLMHSSSNIVGQVWDERRYGR